LTKRPETILKPDLMSPRINELLAHLPESEYELIQPHLELACLTKGQDLFQAGDVPSHVYYPAGAMISVMKDMEDGFSVETFMLGKSSLVGHCASFGPSFYRANVRSSGLAYKMSVVTMRRLMPQCPTLMQSAMKSLGRAIAQLSQAIVCGKHHSVEQQMMRWMLITLDRTFEPVIEMTHQEIADRLGFRREAITLALRKLMERGHIQVRRGSMEVLDRQALEAQVCDCYWIGQEKTKPDFNQLSLLLPRAENAWDLAMRRRVIG
jgi:CRP-like cAMP-binding protein